MTSVLLVVVALASSASAASCERSHKLEASAQAPCSGTLVPDAEARAAALCVAVDLPECRRKQGVELEAARVRHETLERLVLVERERADRLAELLEQATKLEPPDRPWYEHPGFVAASSAVATAAVVLLSVWVAGAL